MLNSEHRAGFLQRTRLVARLPFTKTKMYDREKVRVRVRVHVRTYTPVDMSIEGPHNRVRAVPTLTKENLSLPERS